MLQSRFLKCLFKTIKRCRLCHFNLIFAKLNVNTKPVISFIIIVPILILPPYPLYQCQCLFHFPYLFDLLVYPLMILLCSALIPRFNQLGIKLSFTVHIHWSIGRGGCQLFHERRYRLVVLERLCYCEQIIRIVLVCLEHMRLVLVEGGEMR